MKLGYALNEGHIVTIVLILLFFNYLETITRQNTNSVIMVTKQNLSSVNFKYIKVKIEITEV